AATQCSRQPSTRKSSNGFGAAESSAGRGQSIQLVRRRGTFLGAHFAVPGIAANELDKLRRFDNCCATSGSQCRSESFLRTCRHLCAVGDRKRCNGGVAICIAGAERRNTTTGGGMGCCRSDGDCGFAGTETFGRNDFWSAYRKRDGNDQSFKNQRSCGT